MAGSSLTVRFSDGQKEACFDGRPLGQGFSIKEVMTFAGHASVQMTMERYGHLFPTPDHQHAMAQVEGRLFE